MHRSQLKQLVATPELTASFFCDVATGDEPTAIAAQLLAQLESPPGWIDPGDIVEGIGRARETEAAGVAVYCRERQAPVSAPMIDPPSQDTASVGIGPRLVPLLEAMHRSVDHLVVQIESDSAGDRAERSLLFSHFPMNDKARQWTRRSVVEDFQDLAAAVADEVPSSTMLVLIDCDISIRGAVADRLATVLRVDQKIVRLEVGPLELADEVVRQVADFSATEMVDAIRSFKFAVAHDQAVEGLSNTLVALSTKPVHRLFVSNRVDTDEASEVIRAGILAGVAIQILPAHLADGPADGVGATLVIDRADIEEPNDDSVVNTANIAGATAASVALARAVTL